MKLNKNLNRSLWPYKELRNREACNKVVFISNKKQILNLRSLVVLNLLNIERIRYHMRQSRMNTFQHSISLTKMCHWLTFNYLYHLCNLCRMTRGMIIQNILQSCHVKKSRLRRNLRIKIWMPTTKSISISYREK